MTLTVHYLHPPESELLEDLRRRLDSGITLTTGSQEPLPPETEILIAGRPEREQLETSPALHTLVIPWSGLPETTRTLLLDFPQLAVHNLHHNAAPVAELAFALLLSAAKFILPMDHSLRDGDWTPRYQPSPAVLLQGKRALILGYGAIGRRLAHLCRALDMKVMAIRRNTQPVDNDPVEAIFPPSSLPALLPQTDALLICLPHTPDTDGIIGRQELDLLPPGAVLVNVGRGPVVDEEALFLALRDGRLHAAGLDVWYRYPAEEAERDQTAPSSFPFQELDNVVMSPHRGGATRETGRLRMAHLARLLNAAARGEKLPNRVDVKAGY